MLEKNIKHKVATSNESAYFIEPGPGELPLLNIATPFSTAVVSIYGGQVLAFQPNEQLPVLWTSRKRYAQIGQAIRGGIPICWPWFGPHPVRDDLPNHGIARTQLWTNDEPVFNSDGSVTVKLTMEFGKASRALWNFDCELSQTIRIGKSLDVSIKTTNKTDSAIPISEALHSYFYVRDIRDVSIEGLEQCSFINNLTSTNQTALTQPIRFNEETELFFEDHGPTCLIKDNGLERTIRITKRGSRSTIVWNPWIDKTANTRDMADDEYLQMLCVETANMGSNEVSVAAGQSHEIGVTIDVE